MAFYWIPLLTGHLANIYDLGRIDQSTDMLPLSSSISCSCLV